MLGFRELTSGLKSLGLDSTRPVIVHASLSAFGEVRGGAQTVLGALLAVQPALMMPAFTYKTMLVPEEGPLDNGLEYGESRSQNLMAEFFKMDLPADGSLGSIAETLRVYPAAHRSMHPILSFAGVQVDEALQAQTLEDPLAPVGVLAGQDGWVLLLGVNHTANTSLHYAEKLAGRKQFVRWALTYAGVRECPAFPGCSKGFEKAAVWLENLTRQGRIGGALVRAVPLAAMIERLEKVMRHDPQAFLCDQPDCALCGAVRRSLQPAPDGGPYAR
jgi:aminoglycoside 3-N-acetyltransferase